MEAGSADLIRRIKSGGDLDGQAAKELSRRAIERDRLTLRLLSSTFQHHRNDCDLPARALAVDAGNPDLSLRNTLVTIACEENPKSKEKLKGLGEIVGRWQSLQLAALGTDAQTVLQVARQMAGSALGHYSSGAATDAVEELAQQGCLIFLRRLILHHPLPENWYASLASILFRSAKGLRRKESRRDRILRGRIWPLRKAEARMAEDEQRLLFMKSMVLKFDIRPRLAPAIAHLPERQQQALRDRVNLGLTFAEIAKKHGISESTARRTYAEAITALLRDMT
jgi:RNA polymerase sigma factor (sigma-70 family)